MTTTSYKGITFNAATNTYTVDTSAATADINTAISRAAANAIIDFSAGEHILTSTLYVTRSDITLQGAGRETTTFKLDFNDGDFTGISVKGKADTSFSTTLASSAREDANTITLKNASGLKAGDVLEIQEANTAGNFNADGRYDNMTGTDMWATAPLRQTIAQVKSVNGNVVTLDTPVAYDMDSGVTTVQRLKMLTDVTLKGFTVTPDVGDVPPPDPNKFENALPEMSANVAVSVRYTLGVDVENIGVVNAASRGLQIQQALYANVNDYVAQGAYNKGSNGNGYPLHLEESFYGNFTHISTIDTRHGVIMGSNTAEVGNYIQVDYSNRDVNFHGSPDHDNTVIVDRDVYVGQTKDESTGTNNKGWTLVADGAPDHAWTDLSANTVLFKYASGGYKDDNVRGWDGGAQLFGNEGNDTLTGGAAGDMLSGGADDDTLIGGGGGDQFLHGYGDGNDVIVDFKTGTGGDLLALSGYAADMKVSDLHMTQQGSDTRIFFGTSESYNDSILLKNVQAPALPSNIQFINPVAADTAREISLSDTNDNIETGAGDDVFSAWISYIGSGDIVKAGAGVDTLHFLSQSTFNTANFGKLSGIDVLDFSTVSGERVIISNAFAAQSDAGTVTVKYGAGMLAQLDTSALSAGQKVIVDGSGTVQLANNAGNHVVLSDGSSGRIIGGTGNDDITGGKGNDTMSGGSGRDTFRIASGGGNDTVTDFKLGAGGDILVLSGYKGVKSVADLHFTQQGADALLSFGAGGSILLKGIKVTTPTSDNFQVIAAVNHAPTAQSDRFSGVQDHAISGNVLADNGYGPDSDQDGDVISVIAKTFTTPHGGAVVMKADGSFTYTPAKGYSGADSFVYSIADEDGAQASATVTFTLAPTPVTPPPTGSDTKIDLIKFSNSITTGSGDDTISGYFSYLKAGDAIHAGAGTDTIHFLSQSTMTTANYKNITGIDVLDFSATTGERIIFDNRFLAQSDNGVVTVAYGSGNLLRVDTSAISDAYKVYVEGSGEAHMTDGGGKLYVADGNTGHVYGGKGADDITAGAGRDLLSGGAGQDIFRFASGGGSDTVADFQAGASGDKLVLSDYAGIYGFSDLHFTQQGGDTLLSFGAAGSILLQGVKASSLAAENFEIVGGSSKPPVVDDMSVNLGKAANNIETGAGDDTISGYFSYLKAGDAIHAGAGTDTIHFLSQSTMTTANYKNITGIDVLDFSATTGERIIFDNRFLAQSDNGVVTVAYGSGNLLRVDTSAISDAYKVYVEGSGEAHMTDGGGKLYVADGNTGHVYGGKGADIISGGSADDILYGMNGDDVLIGGIGADRLTGGIGSDSFKIGSAAEGGDAIADFNLIVGERDTLDLTELFAANGLGNETSAAAVAAGHLVLSQAADGVDVGFDKDGLLGAQGAVHLVTLEHADLVHLDLSAILTKD